MSYILDALKKAEAERKLGSVPDMHAQALPITAAGGPAPLWRNSLLWIGLAVLSIIFAALAWFRPWQANPANTVSSPAEKPVSTAGITARSTDEARQAQVVDKAADFREPNKRPEPKTETIIKDESAAIALAPIEKKLPPDSATTQAARKTVSPSVEQKSGVTGGSIRASVPAEVETAEKDIALLRDLPPHIQREMPLVTVGGYIYSPNPAERSMLINNKLLREGEQVAAGLTLERMTPKDAVFNYKGYRYRVTY